MPDGGHSEGLSGSDLVHEVRQEVAAKAAAANADAASKAALARDILDRLNRRSAEASEAKAQQVLRGGGAVPIEVKSQAQNVQKSIAEVLEGVKQGVIVPPGRSADLIRNIDEKIGTAAVTETSAPYLYSLIKDALNHELSSQELAAKYNEIRNSLSVFSYDTVKGLHEAILETADDRKLDISRAEAEQMFAPPENTSEAIQQAQEQSRDQRSRRDAGEFGDFDASSFDQVWNQLYSNYFKEDKEFIRAIYQPERFKELVKITIEEKKKELQTNVHVPHGTDIEQMARQEASEEIEAKLIHTVGKLFTRLDFSKSSEFFEPIIQQDFMHGIQTTMQTLGSAIRQLRTSIEIEERSSGSEFAQIKLFKKAEQVLTTEDVEYSVGEGKNKATSNKPRFRLSPLSREEQVSLSDYVGYLNLVFDHYVHVREYTHNARAILYHPAGEHGFFGELQRFAEHMTTPSFDEMMLLPDAQIFKDAVQLYDKYLDEQFAKQDWKHTPFMFSEERGSVLTKLEQEVLDALRLMYPSEKIDDGRLRSALSMAVGASRGIFMNEVEKAAFADPHLNADGSPSYASYYTNDTAAINTLNPLHTFYRWQSQQSLSPLLFLPIDHFEKGAEYKPWDHHEMWNKMKAYRESFIKGRKELGSEELLIDFMVNIGNVGGPAQRKGWRMLYSNEGNFVYKGETNELDVLKTWKALENIGYEAIHDLVVAPRIKETFLNKNTSERKEFFDYLFEHYYSGDVSDFDAYWNKLRKQSEVSIRKRIIEGKISPASLNEQIELETSQLFLYGSISRLIARRFPTKFIRIDRDRFQNEGVSRWKSVREAMHMSLDDFDKVMKDLLIAEGMLRKEVSTKMRRETAHGGVKFEDLSIDFHLTGDKIRDLLKSTREGNRAGISDERIKKAIDVFDVINSKYAQNTEFLDDFAKYIKDKKYKYTFGLDDTDFSLIPMKGAGNRVIARALSDAAAIENNVIKEVTNFENLLRDASTNGKKDTSQIVASLKKIKSTLEGVHGAEFGQKVVHHLAAMAINFFKKDAAAKTGFGLFTMGGRTSIAAEIAGRSTAVWEWDAREIDLFCIALESNAILPKEPYDLVTQPKSEPIWFTVPFTNRVIKLPDKLKFFGKEISLFTKRKADFEWNSSTLRKQFGADGLHIAWDMLNRYVPVALALLLFYFIKKAFDESFGDKKK